MDVFFFFPAIGPAVFGWVLFLCFILVFLRLSDARKFKVNRTWKKKPETVDRHKLQQSMCEIYEAD